VSNTKLVRRVLLPLALLVSAFAVQATSAQAWTLHEHHRQYFLGMYTLSEPVCGWCTEVTGNIAVYKGAGTVSVCQLTFDYTAGTFHEGCGNNAVGNALNLTPYYGHALDPRVGNNGPGSHTIDQYWYTGTP
jgi:hypothetical protein